jgi:hypothetical protein
MHTITLKTEITESGHLHLDVAAGLPPGPVDVVLVLQPSDGAPHSIKELRGLGRDVWAGEDAQSYVTRLREEWDR